MHGSGVAVVQGLVQGLHESAGVNSTHRWSKIHPLSVAKKTNDANRKGNKTGQRSITTPAADAAASSSSSPLLIGEY